MFRASVRFKFFAILHLGDLILFLFPILCWLYFEFISVVLLDGTRIVCWQCGVCYLIVEIFLQNVAHTRLSAFLFPLHFWLLAMFIFPGIGMDTCVIPLRHGGLSLVQTTDYIYPIVDDPYMMVSLALCIFVIETKAFGFGFEWFCMCLWVWVLFLCCVFLLLLYPSYISPPTPAVTAGGRVSSHLTLHESGRTGASLLLLYLKVPLF